MKDSRRTERVAELVRREVGAMLLREADGAELSHVVLTDCRVSPDLRIARLYYTLLDGDDGPSHEQAHDALERQRGHFRHLLGRIMRSKYTPELHFHFDETLVQARRIEAVLESLGPLDEPTEGPE